MSAGFSNQPKILRGAFVEYGLSLPPLFVVFQFNPLLITRTRTATMGVDPNATEAETARRQLLQNSSFIQAVGRNPSARGDVFTMTMLGFALVEAIALFALVIALIILFG